MSVKKSSKCIDLDTEEHIYHLKVSFSQGRLLLSSCHQGFCWLLSCLRQSLAILPALALNSWASTVPSFRFLSSQGSLTAFPAWLCRGISTAMGLSTTTPLVTWGQLFTMWVVFFTVSLRGTIDDGPAFILVVQDCLSHGSELKSLSLFLKCYHSSPMTAVNSKNIFMCPFPQAVRL